MMDRQKDIDIEELWDRYSCEFRDPNQVIGNWHSSENTSSSLLDYVTDGEFFHILASLGIVLIITREYEHLVIAISTSGGAPLISYLRIPHPSGLAYDKDSNQLSIASTRNPNQLYSYRPVSSLMNRADVDREDFYGVSPLVPFQSRFVPGCYYLHELAYIDGKLYGNSVGQNAVVNFGNSDCTEIGWWPKCVERNGKLDTSINHIQLNSIAAGDSLEESYFTASTDRIEFPRPGNPGFQVDGKGVVFDGKTREKCAGGLTRPHSAIIIKDEVWVDNSGYGELGYCDGGHFRPVVRLPGWTRGLSYQDKYMFVGTSRVIPRFSSYAPGLKIDECKCGIHIIDYMTGEKVGSLVWPNGNQVFSIECIPRSMTTGFPFMYRWPSNFRKVDVSTLFYSYRI